MKKKLLTVLLVLILATSVVLLSSCEALKGLSAYDIAVQQGFSGTEAEWVASLKGADGTNGADGADGSNGVDGVDGSFESQGKTAYEVAVDNGFVGDEAAWLASLKGMSTGASISSAASKAIVSSVSIISSFQYTATQTDFFGNVTTTPNTWSGMVGAGVIISDVDTNGDSVKDTAYIATNYHVVYSNTISDISTYIWVYLYGSIYPSNWTSVVTREADKGDALVAEYVGGSYNNDVAVLKLTGESYQAYLDSVAAPAEIGTSSVVTAGDTAIAIGNPEGLGTAVTSGVISVNSEYININIVSSGSSTLRVMRIDTAVNAGNSGGGLFNSDGLLIGIVNAKISHYSIESISYALPIDNVSAVASSIIANEDDSALDGHAAQLTKLTLGIVVSLTASRAEQIVEGGNYKTIIVNTITVSEVTAGSMAESMGLQVGDVLKTFYIGGRAHVISRLFTLGDALYSARAGYDIYAVVYRAGTETNLQLNAQHITADQLTIVD